MGRNNVEQEQRTYFVFCTIRKRNGSIRKEMFCISSANIVLATTEAFEKMNSLVSFLKDEQGSLERVVKYSIDEL